MERETGNDERRDGSSRKKMTTKFNDPYLKQLPLINPHVILATDLKFKFEKVLGVNLSAKTVQRRLVRIALRKSLYLKNDTQATFLVKRACLMDKKLSGSQ